MPNTPEETIQEGYGAYGQGLERSQNPYGTPDRRNKAFWYLGWDRAAGEAPEAP